MGGKRVGLARTQALIQNLKRELAMAGTQLSGTKLAVKSVTADTTLSAEDSGKVIWWDASTSNTITLPTAAAGLSYKIILKDTVNTDDAARVRGAPGNPFYGLVSLTSTGADGKLATQAVDYDTATGAPPSYAFINFSPDANTTGGTSGDVLIITAVDTAAWHVQATLTTTGTAPASVAAIGSS